MNNYCICIHKWTRMLVWGRGGFRQNSSHVSMWRILSRAVGQKWKLTSSLMEKSYLSSSHYHLPSLLHLTSVIWLGFKLIFTFTMLGYNLYVLFIVYILGVLLLVKNFSKICIVFANYRDKYSIWCQLCFQFHNSFECDLSWVWFLSDIAIKELIPGSNFFFKEKRFWTFLLVWCILPKDSNLFIICIL